MSHQCYLCDHEEAKVTTNAAATRQRVTCPSCGEYTISDWVLSTIAAGSGSLQARPIIAKAARRNFDANTPLSLTTEADWLEALREEAAKSQG